ncbi:MAG: tetratricopeptide repeat protein [Muribaculaceae bacterium]|nr:tetratricopeptide repeat protein [Muribaculaceae bacterium]
MKKLSVLGICLFAGLTAVAQNSLVKEVEREIKSSVDKYPEKLDKLKPAFTNDETAGHPYVWFVAGKGGMDFYDNQEVMKKMGKGVDDKATGNALMNSFDYLLKAMTLDSIPDAKGKIKPKYSKDAINLIKNHHKDLNIAAVNLWQVADYPDAYKAWEMYMAIPSNPVLGENAPAALPDSTASDIYYNMGLAAWQANQFDDALNAFDNAIAKGYTKKNIYDYAIAVAYNNNHDAAKMAYYAEQAYPLYGAEDNSYIGYMINNKIANKEFAEAQQMLEKYIQADPNNGQLYYVLGVLYDSQENPDKAVENYKRAIELNPENAQAQLQYGRQLCNKAFRIDDEISALPVAQYNERRVNEVNPLFREATTYLEKAYELDPDNMGDALSLLRNCYYNLQDEENLKRIESLY